jgi:hypothetical protein
MLTVILLVFTASALGCSDDPSGKANGEPCLSHDECASKLCTTPPAPEAGLPDGGTPAKQCMPSSV